MAVISRPVSLNAVKVAKGFTVVKFNEIYHSLNDGKKDLLRLIRDDFNPNGGVSRPASLLGFSGYDHFANVVPENSLGGGRPSDYLSYAPMGSGISDTAYIKLSFPAYEGSTSTGIIKYIWLNFMPAVYKHNTITPPRVGSNSATGWLSAEFNSTDKNATIKATANTSPTGGTSARKGYIQLIYTSFTNAVDADRTFGIYVSQEGKSDGSGVIPSDYLYPDFAIYKGVKDKVRETTGTSPWVLADRGTFSFIIGSVDKVSIQVIDIDNDGLTWDTSAYSEPTPGGGSGRITVTVPYSCGNSVLRFLVRTIMGTIKSLNFYVAFIN